MCKKQKLGIAGNLKENKNGDNMDIKPMLAANWKMNKTLEEGISFMNELNKEADNFGEKEVVICAPFTLLSELNKIKHNNIKLGAQDCHQEENGTYTGEISASMLKGLCEYVILGHSERRAQAKEGNPQINKKIVIALKHGLKPILCVGETLPERKKNKAMDVVKTQLRACLKNITEGQIKNIIIAYEPVWAISAGQVAAPGSELSATPEKAQEMHDFIRKELIDMYSQGTILNMKILYGGSVNPNNVKELMSQRDLNGGLIGGASLDVNSFINTIKNC